MHKWYIMKDGKLLTTCYSKIQVMQALTKLPGSVAKTYPFDLVEDLEYEIKYGVEY